MFGIRAATERNIVQRPCASAFWETETPKAYPSRANCRPFSPLSPSLEKHLILLVWCQDYDLLADVFVGLPTDEGFGMVRFSGMKICESENMRIDLKMSVLDEPSLCSLA